VAGWNCSGRRRFGIEGLALRNSASGAPVGGITESRGDAIPKRGACAPDAESFDP